MSTARQQRIELVLEDAPESVKKTLARAFSGAASPREAIKAMCLTCTGYDRAAIAKCSAWACPLHAYRPAFKTEGE